MHCCPRSFLVKEDKTEGEREGGEKTLPRKYDDDIFKILLFNKIRDFGQTNLISRASVMVSVVPGRVGL